MLEMTDKQMEDKISKAIADYDNAMLTAKRLRDSDIEFDAKGDLAGCMWEIVEEVERKTFVEIEKELTKHKFNTDMSSWEIVPKLVATMHLLKKKFLKNN